MAKLKSYTILLLNPEELCSIPCSRVDTYYAPVLGEDLEDAIREARTSAADDHRYDGPPEDYQVLLAVEGIHHDLSTGEE